MVADDATEGLAAPAEPVGETAWGVPRSTTRAGETVLHPDRERYPGLVRELRAEGYLQCLDVCAVDYLTHDARNLPEGVVPERFEVVATFLSFGERRRIRVRVQVPESDPTCPSLVGLHPGAGNPEREAFDLFGIRFEGHLDLTRILLPDDWEGHPLRKDNPIGAIPVQFKATSGR